MGRTATDPKTGAKIYLDKSGEWKPARTAQNPETGEKLVFDGDEWKPLDVKESTQQQYDRAEPIKQSAHDISGGLRSFGNTLSFGLTDYAGGVGQLIEDWVGGKDTSKSLGDYRDAEVAKRREWEAMNPKAGMATSIGGAVMNPVNKFLGGWAAKGPTMAAKMGRGVQAGAGMGGLQAAGESQGPLSERLKQTGMGVGVGGTIGGVAPPLVKGATNLLAGAGRKAMHLMSSSGRKEMNIAARKISEALERDQLTPQQAMQRIRELGPEARLIDVGPNTRALGFAANATPGEGKAMLTKVIGGRQEGGRDYGMNMVGGQQSRINAMIDDLIPQNAYDLKKATEASRKFLGGAYETAKKSGDTVGTARLLADINTQLEKTVPGGIRNNLKAVKKMLMKADRSPQDNLEILHNAKMEIDNMMSGGSSTGVGRVSKGIMRDIQNKLVATIEKAGEGGKLYRLGRLGTAQAWRIDDAIEEGTNFMSKGAKGRGPQELDEYLSKLSPEEVQAFKIGAAKALKDVYAGSRKTVDVVKKIFNTEQLEERIKRVFGNKESFRKYAKMLEGEDEMYKTYAKTFGGSETAERQVALKDMAIDPGKFAQGLEDIKNAKYLKGISNIYSGAKEAIFDPEPQSRALAQHLLSRTPPKQVEQAYRAMQRGQGLDENLIRILTQGGAPVVGGKLSQELRKGRR